MVQEAEKAARARMQQLKAENVEGLDAAKMMVDLFRQIVVETVTAPVTEIH